MCGDDVITAAKKAFEASRITSSVGGGVIGSIETGIMVYKIKKTGQPNCAAADTNDEYGNIDGEIDYNDKTCHPENNNNGAAKNQNTQNLFELKPGDHICRDYVFSPNLATSLLKHHGVVYSVPNLDSNCHCSDADGGEEKYHAGLSRSSECKILNETVVFQMSTNGIEKVSLRQFMQGIGIQIVDYKPNEKLPIAKILINIDTLYSKCKNCKELFDFMRNNCEQTAIFVVTGKSDHDFDDQVTKTMTIAKRAIKQTVDIAGEIVKAVTKNSATIAEQGKTVVTSMADDAGALMTTASKVSQATKIMAGVGAGVAVTIEAGLQVYRHSKYKKDASYSLYDYAMDSAESWTGVIATTAISVGLSVGTPIGWFVILPTIGTFGLCWGAWKLGKYLFGKSEKEKWYFQYKINSKDKQSLEDGKVRIEDLIEKENLNPDMFDEYIFNDKEKEYKSKKFLILNEMIENIEIDLAYFDYNNNFNHDKIIVKTIDNAKKRNIKFEKIDS